MNKKLKIIVSIVLCIGIIFSIACKKQDSGKVGDKYLLTIYRSRDAGMTDGVRDDAIKLAIENKFYKDTNINIDLKVELYTNEAICNIVDVNFSNKSKNMEAIIHYLSEDKGSAITKYAKDSESAKNLDPYLNQYGQNILQKINENDDNHLADRAGYFKSNGEYQRTALSSYIKEGGFGILVRKDYMREVQNTTGIDPEDYDICNDNYKNMTISQFEKVMSAIKSEVNTVVNAVNGKPWDLGRVFATSFGVDALNWGFDSDGNYVPSQYTKNWDKYVDLMYRWSRDGIWEKESNNTTDEQRVTNLIAGRCAAYIAYPTAEQLIYVAKKFNAANPTAELMVLAPFASEDSNGEVVKDEKDNPVVNGNLKTARSFYGMIVPYRALNTDILIKFIDWMYSDVNNYELCLYGVKGEDWVEGDDVVYGDKTYKTWAYPDSKADEYLASAPYTGKYCLINNINVSNRVSSHYNTVEKKWFTSLYFDFPSFSNIETESIWIPEAPRTLGAEATEVDGKYVDEIRSYAWVGMLNKGKTPEELLKDYLIETKESCKNYLKYVNDSFKEANEFFNKKYSK